MLCCLGDVDDDVDVGAADADAADDADDAVDIDVAIDDTVDDAWLP